MFKRKDYSKMSTKKKSRILFLGMLFPLLTLTIGACTFFYIVSNGVLKEYLKAQLELSVTQLNDTVTESMQPIIINLDSYATLSTNIDDEEILDFLIKTYAGKLDAYASMFYYAPVKKLSAGGLFLSNLDWVPPKGFEPSERDWFLQAVENSGKVSFSTPYLDKATGELCTTVSQAVFDTKGKVKGVVACDILLENLIKVVNSIQLSQNARLSLIDASGLFMTNDNPEFVMAKNWKDFTKYKGDYDLWMNGETKTAITSRDYFAICKVGITPWFFTVEGPVNDYNGILSRIIITFEVLMLIFSIVASIANIAVIRRMREGESDLASSLFEEAQNLVVSAKENAATSQDQSAAVKEIVATMEDNTALSEDVSQKVKDVSGVALKTNNIVAEGVSFIASNMQQLKEIEETNLKTISGIKSLGDKIESIWEIVSLINSVADQAKIIAFNAELEASSAGEAGKNFHIVATEIRRLADGIIDSTKEIKGRITEIQESSDDLILSSENGTEKILAGVENAKNLEERFDSIKNASEITAESAEKITSIIQQQAMASEQILITLKQISSGIENFTMATDSISSASEKLKNIATELSDKRNLDDE